MAGCSPGQHTRACKKCSTPYIVTVGPAGVDIAARPGEQPETKTQESCTAQQDSLIELIRDRAEKRKEKLAKVLEAYHKDKHYTKEELESSKGYPFQL